MSDFTDAVEGFDLGDAVGRTWNASQSGAAPVSSVTGIVTQKLRQVHSLTRLELPVLKAPKPAPDQDDSSQPHAISSYCLQARRDRRVYPDPSALLWDVVEIIKSDLSQLSSEGVAYIQIDAPRYSYYLAKVAFLDSNGSRNRPRRRAR